MQALQDAMCNLTVVADSLPFRPPEHWMPNGLSLNWGFKKTPRYLFRLSTADSDGTTTNDWVKSMSVVVNHPDAQQDCFARSDRAQVADEICKHLRWRRKDHDNFVSWTSSFVFVLQYAFFRKHRERDGQSNLDSICICVIDTAKFGRQTFIRDLDLIAAYKPYHLPPKASEHLSNLEELRHKRHREFQGSFYFGEYLSQGALKVEGKIAMVTLRSLVDNNVNSLRPDMNTCSEEWANAVIRLRDTFKHGTYSLNEKQSQAVFAIARLFGGHWQLPLAANLLGLLPRSKDDRAITACLKQMFLAGAKDGVYYPLKVLPGPSMPEVEQTRQIFNEFCLDESFDDIGGCLVLAESSLRKTLMSLYKADCDLAQNSKATRDKCVVIGKQIKQMNFLKGQLDELLVTDLA